MTDIFRTAENNADMQLCTAYTIYAYLKDLYHSCNFKSPIEETHLKMHFLMQGKNQREENIMKVAWFFFRRPAKTAADLACEVSHYMEGDSYILLFRTYFTDIEAVILPDGRIGKVREA